MGMGLADGSLEKSSTAFYTWINSTVRVFETADIESSSDHPVDGKA